MALIQDRGTDNLWELERNAKAAEKGAEGFR